MEKKTLGSFIAALRKAKGLTQQDLADKLFVSNKAVSKWECGETSPDISLLPAIAEVLEVSCDELLHGQRILDKEKIENRTDKRTDKQLKLLVNKSLFKYKNISLISVVLIFVAFVVMLAVSYAAYRPTIAFAIAVSILFVAAAMQVFALSLLKSKTSDSELFDQNSNDILKMINSTRYLYSFWIFYTVLFAFFLFLPLITPLILFNGNFFVINSVITFETYLQFVPLYAIAPITIVFAAKELYKRLIFKGEADTNKTESNKSGKTDNLTSKGKNSLITLDLSQVGIMLISIVAFFSSFFSYYFGFGLYIYALFCFIISLLLFALITRNKRILPNAAAITLRNCGYIVALMLFFASSHTINGEIFVIINGRSSLLCAILLAATIAIYALFTRNKNIYSLDN